MVRPDPEPELFAAASGTGLVLSPDELPDSHPVKTVEPPENSNLIASVVISTTDPLVGELRESPHPGTHFVKGVLKGEVERFGMVEIVVVGDGDPLLPFVKKLRALRARRVSSPTPSPPEATRGRDAAPSGKDAMSEKEHRGTDGDLLAENKISELAARAQARVAAELLRLRSKGVIDDKGEARDDELPEDMKSGSATDV